MKKELIFSHFNIKNLSRRLKPGALLPYLIFLTIIFVLFSPFFTKGYVLDGNADGREQIVPFHIICLRSLQNKQIPQWNPYIFCGTSFLASAINGFFYPLNWIAYSFPEKYLPKLLTLLLIIHVFFAGVFSFLFFKKLIGDAYWAMCGSVSYLFSASSVMNMTQGTNSFSSFLYLPLWLYLIFTYKERNLLPNIIYQAITIALLLLSGMLQNCLYVFGFCLLFAVFNVISNSADKLTFDLKPLLITFGCTIMALMISAIRLLPFYYNIKGTGQIIVPYSYLLQNFTTAKSDLLRLFVPEFFGNSLNSPFFGSINHFETFSCYVGVVCAFFSLYAFLFIWNHKTLFWKLIIVLVLLTILGTPLTLFNYIITARSPLMFNRLAWLLPICLAALFGYAGKVITRERRHLMGVIFFFPHLFLIILIFLFMVYRQLPQNAQAVNAGIIKESVVYFVYVYFAMTGILFSLVNWGFKNKPVKVSLFLIIVIDLLIIGRMESNNANKFLSPEPFFQHSDFDKKVASEFVNSGRNFRILGQSKGTIGDICISLGLYNSSGYDSVVSPFILELFNYPGKGDRIRDRKSKPDSTRREQLTSTAYIVNDGGISGISPSLPRVKLFNKYIVMSQDNEALEKLLDPQFDIFSTVVLKEEPKLEIRDTKDSGTVRIIRENNNQILLDVFSNSNAILLLTDTYDEGWGVSIDDMRGKIKRGNFAFRTVEIPKGQHRIKFYFTHKGFTGGSIITIISLSIFFLLCFARARLIFSVNTNNKIG